MDHKWKVPKKIILEWGAAKKDGNIQGCLIMRSITERNGDRALGGFEFNSQNREEGKARRREGHQHHKLPQTTTTSHGTYFCNNIHQTACSTLNRWCPGTWWYESRAITSEHVIFVILPSNNLPCFKPLNRNENDYCTWMSIAISILLFWEIFIHLVFRLVHLRLWLFI